MKTYGGLEDSEQEFQLRSECGLCCFMVRKEQRILFTDETDEECKILVVFGRTQSPLLYLPCLKQKLELWSCLAVWFSWCFLSFCCCCRLMKANTKNYIISRLETGRDVTGINVPYSNLYFNN